MELLFSGPMFSDFALFVNRVVLGLFFVLARFRWFYSPDHPEQPWFNFTRHKSLRDKMVHCGITHNPSCWACCVAWIEVLAGLALIVGLLTPLAGLGLLILCIRATMCTAREKTMRQNPVDRVDVVSCYLWTPEPMYIVMSLIATCMGAGSWSLDALVLAWLK